MKECFKGWDEFWAQLLIVELHNSFPTVEVEKVHKKVVDHILHATGLHPGSKFLDLACGNGKKTLQIAKRGGKVVGLDITEKLIQFANKLVKEQDLSGNARFIQGDMRKLNFRNEFDCVTVLAGSFGFFDDSGNLRVLQEIKKEFSYRRKILS